MCAVLMLMCCQPYLFLLHACSSDSAERNGNTVEKHDDSETASKERRHSRRDEAWEGRFRPGVSFVVLAIFFVNQIPMQLPSWMMQGIILAGAEACFLFH